MAVAAEDRPRIRVYPTSPGLSRREEELNCSLADLFADWFGGRLSARDRWVLERIFTVLHERSKTLEREADGAGDPWAGSGGATPTGRRPGKRRRHVSGPFVEHRGDRGRRRPASCDGQLRPARVDGARLARRRRPR
jgi:hypothetical protein